MYLGDKNDQFTGLSGASLVDGGNGDDTIRVGNAERDNVICGPGLDTVIADSGDWIDASCENVTRVSA